MDLPERIDDLARSAREGDRQAFGQLLERFRSRLESWVRIRMGRGVRKALDVEDVVQETLLRALEACDRFRWDGERAFAGWLCRIAENAIQEGARARRGQTLGDRAEIPDGAVTQSRAERRNERFGRLEKALDSLPPDYRQVIFLSRIQGIPIQEVAGIMSRSPNAVSHLLIRAMTKLKEIFGDTESLGLPQRSLEAEEAGDGSREA
ncbi:MAG: sigma-70 family RNA polymerase sigma factor [Planctomycetes bacterium]|nr:sigma-70 family RNA polymerase sigma factor [Planctomycetota bacterium]